MTTTIINVNSFKFDTSSFEINITQDHDRNIQPNQDF